MFTENSRKFLTLALSILSFAACGVWQKTETANTAPGAPVAEKTSSEIPFSTREAESYQAEIVTTSFAGGEKVETKIFTARANGKNLTIFNFGTKREISRVESGVKIFLASRAERVYAENSANQNGAPESSELKDFLTTEWVNGKTPATFENLGAKDNLTEYRVKSGDAETFIFFDENLKIPVRQEFYDAQKTLVFSNEIKNYKTPAGDEIFDLPKDFRKISPKEFQDILRQKKTKDE